MLYNVYQYNVGGSMVESQETPMILQGGRGGGQRGSWRGVCGVWGQRGSCRGVVGWGVQRGICGNWNEFMAAPIVPWEPFPRTKPGKCWEIVQNWGKAWGSWQPSPLAQLLVPRARGGGQYERTQATQLGFSSSESSVSVGLNAEYRWV